MRFLTASQDLEFDIYVIVGEMINYMTNTLYYKNGLLVDKLQKEYNSYTVDNIIYNIKTNSGIVFYLCDIKITKTLYTTFNNVFQIMVNNAKQKFGPIIMQQYVSNDSKYIYEYFEYELDPNEHDYINQKHQPRIFNWELMNEQKIKIHEDDKKYHFHGMNCIVYHNNYFTIRHDQILLKSIDRRDCIVYNNNTVLDKFLSYDPYYGIVKNFKLDMRISHSLKYIVPSDIPWTKWENIIALKRRGYHNFETFIYDIVDNRKEYYTIPRDNKLIHCFITGVPIYDLCYVVIFYKLYELVEPVSIVISPYAFDRYISIVNSVYKFVVYKSFSPISCEDRIKEYYHDNPTMLMVMTKMNQGIEIDRNNPSIYNFDNYSIVPYEGNFMLTQTKTLKDRVVYFNF
jgi:hypothetical protein